MWPQACSPSWTRSRHDLSLCWHGFNTPNRPKEAHEPLLHPNLRRHPPQAAAHPSFLCIPALVVKASWEGGLQGAAAFQPRQKAALDLMSIPSPWEDRYPGCSRLGDDGMQQLIGTNGPRKAGRALQRRTHSSNNLNSSTFPSRKSLRREERPYSRTSLPHLHRNLAGDVGKEGKTSDVKCEQRLLEEAGAWLDVQSCFLCLLGQTDGSPGKSPAPSTFGSVASPRQKSQPICAETG